MYFWKDNPDNNVKAFQHELFQRHESKSQRNLLGLQKESTFLDEFSMSDLMSIELMKVDAKANTDFYYLLSPPKIIDLLLLGSVCYFLIAT